MRVVDLDIGDRIFSKLYDVFKNHCNLSAHFFKFIKRVVDKQIKCEAPGYNKCIW